MDDRYDEFENFLRSFNPIQPSALSRPRSSETLWLSRTVALAALTLAATLAVCFIAQQRSLWKTSIERSNPAHHSNAVLTRLAVENPDRFNWVVEHQRLPRFDQPSSALHSLARD